MSTDLAVKDSAVVALPAELTIDELVARTKKVQQAMVAVMRPGEHYGIIPGTQKPTLLKPGAEKLLTLFMLDPQYDDPMMTYEGNHLTVVSRCTLYHIPTGRRVGSGLGSCSTKESRYAYRQASRACPACGVEAIIKGKVEFGGGWVCFKKKAGCGAKYKDEDAAITSQPVGRVPNEDLPDQYNTVLKMSNKRGLTAAVLNVTAASDIFTQDMEDAPAGEETQTIPDESPDKFAPPRVSRRARVEEYGLPPLDEGGASPTEDAGRGDSDRPEPSTAAPLKMVLDEAGRLRPVEPGDPPLHFLEEDKNESQTLRSMLLGEIHTLADQLKIDPEMRKIQWRQVVGDVKKSQATVAQLTPLRDALKATRDERKAENRGR